MSGHHPPGSAIGILGGGQLGRMLTEAARRMSYRVVVWVGGPDGGPAGAADVVIEESFHSPEGLERFVSEVDVATVEFENIPRDVLEAVAERRPLRPGPEAVAVCQHREREKRFLRDGGFPCAGFSVVDSADLLADALEGLPDAGGILKTAEFGYDGKGQLPVAREDDADDVWSRFEAPRAVLEEKIDLAAELSVLVARDRDGVVASYDPAENHHRDHILDVSIVPARLEPEILDRAGEIALEIARALDYVGLLAVEFFLAADGRLLVNELAPRPHNSGHHSIDACATSQFAQQLRAMTGLPLGDVRLHSPAVMLNLLGDVWGDGGEAPDWASVLALPGAGLHLYGKREPRAGRKMGHVTCTAPSLERALETQHRCREILGIPPLRG